MNIDPIPDIAWPTDSAARLENGELLVFRPDNGLFPSADAIDLLISEEVGKGTHRDITFDPLTQQIRGHGSMHEDLQQRVWDILYHFSRSALSYLQSRIPDYADAILPEMVTLRPHEEATRSLRHTCRNDWLHLDLPLDRSTGGKRVLSLNLNLNPTEPRVWVTSERLPELLERFRREHRIPYRSLEEWCAVPNRLQRVLSGDWSGRTHYDALMQRLNEFLKGNEAFQEKATRRYWHFPPLSAWLFFSDGLSHAVLRGQYALEYRFLVPIEVLRSIEHSPLGMLQEFSSTGLRRAS